MSESTQHALSRVRPPRVQITYDVEIGDAIEKRELPFIVGMMADLSGEPAEPLGKIKDRKFTEIDRDNFNDVLAAAGPRLALRVPNRLTPPPEGEGEVEMLNAELKFEHMDDFEPKAIIDQVPAMKKLMEARSRLRDLLTKLDGNDELDGLLRELVHDPARVDELKKQLADGADNPADDS